VTGYTSRIELPPANTSLAANPDTVKGQIDTILAPLDFHSVAEKSFWPVYASTVAEWKMTKERGFWLGGYTVTVALSVQHDLLVVTINCDDTESRKEVRQIQGVLQTALADKFPTFKFHIIEGYDITAMPP
jgi:hypothetical protein